MNNKGKKKEVNKWKIFLSERENKAMKTKSKIHILINITSEPWSILKKDKSITLSKKGNELISGNSLNESCGESKTATSCIEVEIEKTTKLIKLKLTLSYKYFKKKNGKKKHPNGPDNPAKNKRVEEIIKQNEPIRTK